MNEKSVPEQAQAVVASPNMVPPNLRKALEKREYTTRPDAPATHARLWGDPDGNAYHLMFNGADLVTLRYPDGVRPGLRLHSDGDFQSVPFVQQFLAWADQDAPMEVEFTSPVEMWNMRPQRAQGGQAILGQTGHPLLFGVNGLYFPDWDLLLSFHGLPFAWTAPRIERADGQWRARLRVTLGETPWVLLVRPRYYQEHLGYAQHRPWRFRPNPKPITGWCSWEAYHSGVTQADLEADSLALAPLKNYGLEYMQLDDGYQQTMVPLRPGANVGDSWLNTNEKFPGGHEAIVRAARAGGFTPGIWTNATLTNREAAQAMPCCLRDQKGDLICGDWIHYILDCLPETLAAHVTPYYRALREKGYAYFKSDSIRHLIYDGLQEAVRLGVLEPEDARERFRAYLEAARAGIGPDAYYLSCWGVLAQSIGVCDAMRVATDANPSWGAYSMQLRETARWFFAQRVLFTVDPDHVCARSEPAWVRMMLSLVCLSGGLLMISDKPQDYDENRLNLIRKTMPALAVRAAETGPVDYTTPACPRQSKTLPLDEAARRMAHIAPDDDIAPFSSLWCIHFEENGRQWAVVERAAVVPLRDASIALEALSLDPARRYCAFDFWAQEASILEQGALPLRALSLGDAQVVALTDITDGAPRLVGSDRHVSADAVSVLRAGAEDGGFALELSGFDGLTVRYTLYAPVRRAAVRSNEGCAAKIEPKGDWLVLSVSFHAPRAQILLHWEGM